MIRILVNAIIIMQCIYIHVLGLVFDVFGGFITPAIRRTMRCEIGAQPAELPLVERSV